MKVFLKVHLMQLAQKYCGMTPKDLGCKNYAEMQEKFAEEAIECIKKDKELIPPKGFVRLYGAGSDAIDKLVAEDKLNDVAKEICSDYQKNWRDIRFITIVRSDGKREYLHETYYHLIEKFHKPQADPNIGRIGK